MSEKCLPDGCIWLKKTFKIWRNNGKPNVSNYLKLRKNIVINFSAINNGRRSGSDIKNKKMVDSLTMGTIFVIREKV